MKIKNLIVERKPSYDDTYPNMLVGLVQAEGPHGKIEVKLSSEIVSSVMDLVRGDCVRVAKYNSENIGEAVSEASGEIKLLNKDDGLPF